MFNFASDNAAAVHPRIMDALADSNHGFALPYGQDDLSKTLDGIYSELFKHETFVFPVSSGTAANGLALGTLTPSYGAIFCQRLAHILLSEGGGPEFYTGGCRLIPLDGGLCKIDPGALEAALAAYGAAQRHQMKAAVLSVTQATERGTLYSLTELRELSECARAHGMKVHMDGARFANAVAALGCSPAELTWKAGIDALSFGTTKNGTMMAEAVIVFDGSLAEDLRFRHKRAGFLHSKMRYFTSQLVAYAGGGLWLENAEAANANAARIAGAFAARQDCELAFPVETNQVFVHIPPDLVEKFASSGFAFRTWAGQKPHLHRLVTSFADEPGLITRLEAVLAQD